MSKQLARAIQQLIQAEAHNWRVKTKAEMLMNAQWRARVLRDLGGEKALTRWERLSGHWRKTKDILKPHASPAQRRARAANLEKAQLANRDKRFKSGPKRKAGDDYHPNIVFDRVKVDMEGQFRLAPIMRQKIKIKAQATPSPTQPKTHLRSITYTKINPIPLWPIEFRAAQGMEAYETKSAPPNPVIPHLDTGSLPSTAKRGRCRSGAQEEAVCGVRRAQKNSAPNSAPLEPWAAPSDPLLQVTSPAFAVEGEYRQGHRYRQCIQNKTNAAAPPAPSPLPVIPRLTRKVEPLHIKVSSSRRKQGSVRNLSAFRVPSGPQNDKKGGNHKAEHKLPP